MNLKEIQQLVKLISTSNVDVLEIEKGDFHLKIKRNEVKHVAAPMMAAPMQQAPLAQPAQPVAESSPKSEASIPAAEAKSSGVEIKSPMIGTFYRSASPDKPAFVSVGDEVKVGQTLCIVEAMKLFNEIESEVAGTIIKVLVDDVSPVEYDQPLFLIVPD